MRLVKTLYNYCVGIVIDFVFIPKINFFFFNIQCLITQSDRSQTLLNEYLL